MSSELSELLEKISLENFLDREMLDYRLTSGSSGQQLNIQSCPFCGTSKWKVFANINTGLGNCFSGSCERRFNIYSFIRETLSGSSHFDIMQVIRSMALESGYRPKVKSYNFVDNPNKLIMPDAVALPYNGKNLSYLAQRGVNSDICAYFHLRYCATGAYEYLTHDGKKIKQSYKNRIIIPIYNISGELVSFQGRDITGTAEKKYLFPPGIASTAKYLFNAHNAVRSDTIIIAEGVFDVMSLWGALVELSKLEYIQPVATFGKHLSEEQRMQLLALKEKGLKRVIFCWDSESLAIKAAIHFALSVVGLGLEALVAILPKGKDPNESTTAEIKRAIENAYKIDKLMAVRLLSQL